MKGLLVKKRDGTIYEGNCWPGDSVYIDFINPKARKFWADQFALDKSSFGPNYERDMGKTILTFIQILQYAGSTKDVYTWNDMNEPSVFSGPEVTMQKDLVHHGGLEHREVHNLYGFYQHEATFAGQLSRADNELRPFVLSRAFFAGSQRTAAASIPMLLSLSTAGIPLVGADVGGFFGDPDEELLNSYDEDRQWMVGNALLVKPIVEKDATQVSMYLAGRGEVWYDWETSKPRPSPGAVQNPVTLKSIPMYQRGGTVIPVRERVRRSSQLMREDPITLYIALNMKDIYLQYLREHDYLHVIINKNLDKKGTLESDVMIEKIVVRGVKFFPRTAHIYLDDFTPDPLDFDYDRDTQLMEIKSPNAYITRDFRIDIHT
ncbi:unnamed protein product [Strongylus vulgaris]|uniref:Glycoside hydrolase family 31 N-terminal domain-containing protein n=1 Tax=Strongylus vulgaris TaxID=40348 RepID=A0A3P7L219_STRVU|nr:unnamed protein product [Strongylus vulgaris]